MNVLFLVSRVPYPLEKGDKLRAFHHLRLLSERHTVTLVALTDGPVHRDADAVLRRYCHDIHFIRLSLGTRLLNLGVALFKGRPLSSGYFYSKAAQKSIERIINESRPDHIYCQLTRVCEYVLSIKSVPKTLDYQDAFAKSFERRIDREPYLTRWLYRMEQRRLLRYEALVLDEFNNTTIISSQDRDFIDHPNRHVIDVIPNGVDFDYFQPQQVDKKYDLLFTGNMGYAPNIESVLFLVNEILPLVWKSQPGVKLLVAGASPNAKIRALQCERVHVTGWVDDIRESYACSRIFVAPMLISTGLQNKLLEAMAMHIPCVTSELANNALGGTHGSNVLICSSPREYASAILHLLTNPDYAFQLSAAGYKFVREHYGWREVTRTLLKFFEVEQKCP